MKKHLNTLLLTTLFMLPVYAGTAQVTGTYTLKDIQEYEILKIEKGQTLYSLAKSYHTSVSALLELNPSLVDNNLKAGSTIKVPKLKNEVNSTGKQKSPLNEVPKYSGIGPQQFLVPVNYRVGKDETIYSIAKKTGNDVEVIKLWNDINSDLIKPGQDLVVGYGDGTYTRIPNPEGDKMVDATAPPETNPTVNDNNKTNTVKTKPNNDNKTKPVSNTIKTNTSTSTSNSTTTVNKTETTPSPKTTTSPNSNLTATTTTTVVKKEDKPVEPLKITTSVYDHNKPDAKLVYITEKGLCTYTKGSSGNNHFALHPSAPIGAMINVRNMMNNKSLQVKVIGRLPNTPENENILIKLSGSAAQALNAVDDRFLVQLSYMGYEAEKPDDKK